MNIFHRYKNKDGTYLPLMVISHVGHMMATSWRYSIQWPKRQSNFNSLTTTKRKVTSFSLGQIAKAEAKSALPAAYKYMVPFPFGNISFQNIERNSICQSSIWKNLRLIVFRLCPCLGHRFIRPVWIRSPKNNLSRYKCISSPIVSPCTFFAV